MSFNDNVPWVFQKHPNAFDEFLTKTTAPPASAVPVRVRVRTQFVKIDGTLFLPAGKGYAKVAVIGGTSQTIASEFMRLVG